MLYIFRNKLYNSYIFEFTGVRWQQVFQTAVKPEWATSLFNQVTFLYIQVFQRTKKPKHLKQPNDNGNYDNYVEDVFDLTIHRDVGVHKPEKNTYNNQYN